MSDTSMRLKKRAKNLQRLLPAFLKAHGGDQTLAACQELTAAMDGYPNWHSALKAAGAQEPRQQAPRDVAPRVVYDDYLSKICGWAEKHEASTFSICFVRTSRKYKVEFDVGGTIVRPEQFVSYPRSLEVLRNHLIARFDNHSTGGSDSDDCPELVQGLSIKVAMDGHGEHKRVLDIHGDVTWLEDDRFHLRCKMPYTASSAPDALVQLGFGLEQAEWLYEAYRHGSGMILLSGVGDSGISKTISTIVAREFQSNGRRTQPKCISIAADMRTDSSKELQAIRRTAFDFLVLDEFADRQDMEIMNMVLSTGHGCIAGMHAADPFAPFARMASPSMELGQPAFEGFDVVRVLSHQRRLPRLCPHCSIPADAHAAQESGDLRDLAYRRVKRLRESFGAVGDFRVRNEAGCPHCHQLGVSDRYGYKGETIAAEVVPVAHLHEVKTLLGNGNWQAAQVAWKRILSSTAERTKLPALRLMKEEILRKQALGEIDMFCE